MSSGLKCSICLVYTSFKEGDYFVNTPCGHVFHFECLRGWIICQDPKDAMCPLCRRQINLKSVVKLHGISPADINISRKLANFKFVIIGDSGTGKTSLLLQYAKGIFFGENNATIGCDLYFKNVEVAGKVISLSIWDCGGQDRFDAITPNYMRNAHGVFLVYDITNAESFEHLNKWLKLTKDYAPSDVPMILIGNKTDMPDIREVSTEKGKALARDLDINFLETSAKESYNVEAAFRTLTAAALDSLQQAGFADVLELANFLGPNITKFLCRPELLIMEDDLTIVQYSFITGKVPRYHVSDPEGLNLVKQQVPVIFTGSDLVSPAMKWNLEYLKDHLGPGPFAVFIHSASDSVDCNSNGIEDDPSSHPTNSNPHKSISRKRHHLFKYFDQKKADEYTGEFVPDIIREEMTFEHFLAKYNGDRDKERVYFQQPLNNTVGRQIATDFVKFNWTWNIRMTHEWSWGRKRFFLFPPEYFPNLYPYPVHHPHDRQSQVDFDFPDLDRFPKFREAKGVEAIISPGEILYIPMYWWHHVINADDTIAINFWHKDGANTPIEYPLKSYQKVAMVRNIEKMLLQALQDQNDLQTILHWLVDGRF
ncbi:unnamed protein product [Allacma fusca]|uniref:Uncharacterized protein n=1 Tax=Allacma fusca TaxID=39272 RepID=A0A8J2Q2U8_9HEXA|nr:unnamed protein product [Allacma fusca]